MDTRIVHEASERRVAPGTPIHSLKKRLRRTQAAETRAPAQHNSVPVAAKSAAGGCSAANQTARAQAKGKAAAAARVPGHVNGVSRSLDAARTKEVSDYLKSQISEANMLLEVRAAFFCCAANAVTRYSAVRYVSKPQQQRLELYYCY